MHTATYSTLFASGTETVIKPVFRVLIAYEDFSAGRHARETYDFLTRQLGGELMFDLEMWNFDVLRNAKLREMAVRDAVAADLIIVSSHGVGEVPFGFKAWIDTWATGDFKAIALVNLVDRQKDQKIKPSTIRAHLQRVALEARVGFFAQPDEWPEAEGIPDTLQISHRVSQTSAMMANLIQQHAPASRFAITA